MQGQIIQRSQRWRVLSFIIILLLSAPAWSQSRDVIEISYYKIKIGLTGWLKKPVIARGFLSRFSGLGKAEPKQSLVCKRLLR